MVILLGAAAIGAALYARDLLAGWPRRRPTRPPVAPLTRTSHRPAPDGYRRFGLPACRPTS